MEIKVLKNILDANVQTAERNRELLDSNNVFTVNLMASPGAGKTSLVLGTIRKLEGKARVGVIVGDVSSSIDAELIAGEGVPVVQINTGGEYHLDANMIQRALENLSLSDIDLLLIENVGNLIIPAEFVIGEHRKVVISSVPEGDDKPFKYPLMFTAVDAVVINKIDLLPYLKFDVDTYIKAVKGINKKVDIFQASCTTGEGIQKWIHWLETQMHKK